MPIEPSAHRRIVVIGSSCAGKSTFAGALSHARGCARVELDELHWGPAWVPKPAAEFLRLVDEATAGEDWVAAGNYSPARELLWTRATTIVWLDLSLPRVLWRGLWRSLARVSSGEALFHGNRETLRRTFLSRESILWWIASTFGRRRREFARLCASGEFAHLAWHHARTPAEARELLRSLARRD